jgi:hypothetical protein
LPSNNRENSFGRDTSSSAMNELSFADIASIFEEEKILIWQIVIGALLPSRNNRENSFGRDTSSSAMNELSYADIASIFEEEQPNLADCYGTPFVRVL